MTQISILSGTYTDESADWRSSMPVNKEPVFGQNGISSGYLGTVPGIATWATGYGRDRGAINWNGVCYRVMGSKLLSVADGGVVTVLGDVGDDGYPVSMDYSFDRLAITSNVGMWYLLAAGGLVQVTNVNLGAVYDVLFIDGRFMMTDGTYLVITDLTDPMSITPLNYGSAETDPDPIMAICKIRNEVYALGQYTIQNFQDVGGTGFPFSNNTGGLIPRGICGRKSWSYFNESFAFLGCARREQPSVYIAGAGQSQSISTQEVDKLLAALTPAQLSAVVMEQRNEQNEQRLYMHLPDRTLVYMNQASITIGQPVWVTLREAVTLDQPYTARNMVPVYGKWVVGSTTGNIGYLTEDLSTRWGVNGGWQFQTNFIYNESRGAIIHRLELVGLTGRGAAETTVTQSMLDSFLTFDASPPFTTQTPIDNRIFMSTSIDGETWGQEVPISAGVIGQRAKRLVWWPNRRFASFMAVKFRGIGNNHISFARLEADIEPLAA